MKMIVLKISALCMLVMSFASCDNKTIVARTELPEIANTFINEHFNTAQVLSVVKEKHVLAGNEYEVLLSTGVQIKFDKNGNWDEVEAKGNIDGIPSTFIAPSIMTYITDNYPAVLIKSIDKERNNFEVELINGLDLVFDQEGKFLRIDP